MDVYSKSILSVIALCLAWMCIRDVFAVGPAQAQQPQLINLPKEMVGCQEVQNTYMNLPIGGTRTVCFLWVKNM